MPENHWKIASRDSIPIDLLEMASQDSLVARLLVNRGVSKTELAKYFLDLGQVEESSSYEIPEMDAAVDRISSAIDNKESILIWGDYDVDGTTSAALMYRAFGILGIEVRTYIPNRLTEGYGLNKVAIKNIREHLNVDLMITCDCGISNYAEVEFANSIGLDVIVTDHHSLPENPPPSIANCNPKTLPADHPLHYLPGVGVAYKLAEALITKYTADPNFARVYTKSLLDLVALGMVADLAPLKSENRYLTLEGLKVLAKTTKPGLRQLLKICGVKDDPEAEHIGFGLAPRINAAGRLADANQAVRLMTTNDPNEAEMIADELDASNKERQELCNTTMEEAMDLIAETVDFSQDKVIALAKEGWHHGVIGIVASRILERFHLPVFIMAIEEGITKGSVRCVDLEAHNAIDVFEEMNKIQGKSSLFMKYGGHKLAAGFSCAQENTQALIAAIKDHFNVELSGRDLAKTIKIDADLFLKENSEKLLKRINTLAPYGIENPSPSFLTGPVRVQATRNLGNDGKHLKLFLKDASSAKTYEAILWNRAQDYNEEFIGQSRPEIAIVYSPSINEFRGERVMQLTIKDWKDFAKFDQSLLQRTGSMLEKA